MDYDLSIVFPKYKEFYPQVPLRDVTSTMDRTIRSSLLRSPLTPSGWYLGQTRLPYGDRLPRRGIEDEIFILDIETGESKIVAKTNRWDSQFDPGEQWGVSENELVFINLALVIRDLFRAVIDNLMGNECKLEGTNYFDSTDGKHAISPCLKRIEVAQQGFIVAVSKEFITENIEESTENGIFIKDIRSGKGHFFIPIEEICQNAKPVIPVEEKSGEDFYCFHVRWIYYNSKAMLVLRWIPRDKVIQKMRSWLMSVNYEVENVRVFLSSDICEQGGHHQNWSPTEDQILLNLRVNTKARQKFPIQFLQNKIENSFPIRSVYQYLRQLWR